MAGMNRGSTAVEWTVGGETRRSPRTDTRRHPTGYPWRVALQRWPRLFRRTTYQLQGVARLRSIDVHGDVHGERPEREAQANQGEGIEACGAAYEPRETEDNRPCDSDSNYIYDEWEAIRTPVPPRGETYKCQHDSGTNDISCNCINSVLLSGGIFS